MLAIISVVLSWSLTVGLAPGVSRSPQSQIARGLPTGGPMPSKLGISVGEKWSRRASDDTCRGVAISLRGIHHRDRQKQGNEWAKDGDVDVRYLVGCWEWWVRLNIRLASSKHKHLQEAAAIKCGNRQDWTEARMETDCPRPHPFSRLIAAEPRCAMHDGRRERNRGLSGPTRQAWGNNSLFSWGS